MYFYYNCEHGGTCVLNEAKPFFMTTLLVHRRGCRGLQIIILQQRVQELPNWHKKNKVSSALHEENVC